MMSFGLGLGLNLGSSRDASAKMPDFYRSFDTAVAGYKSLADYRFGTSGTPIGSTRIADTTELERHFNFYANNLPSPTSTINVENQRYMDFHHSENYVFSADALELTATLPNGAVPGVSETVLATPANASQVIAVADARGIAVGQILSLGERQYQNLHLTRSHGIRGAVKTGDTATLTITLTAIGQPNAVFKYTVESGSTLQAIAQYFVDSVNDDAALQAVGIYAFKQPVNPGGYCIVIPQRDEPDAPAFGQSANGSLQWASSISGGSGTLVNEGRENFVTTYVVAKSGNTLTLNHKITAGSGQTLHIMPSRMMPRTNTYMPGGSSAILPVGDVTGIAIGQAMQFGPQDPNLRRVTAIDAVKGTITVNGTVSFLDGAYVVSQPIWMAAIAAPVNASKTLTFSADTFPDAVRVGQQVQIYNTNANSNIRITAIDRAVSPNVVTLDGTMTAGAGAQLMFYEPIHSAQIWTKTGYTPGEKGRDWIALELECDLPNAANLAAWPAFWIFRDYTNSTGQPVPPASSSEIDMTDLFNYWNQSNTNSHRPANGKPSTELYRHPAHNGQYMFGNNMGRQTRKIQLIWSVDKIFFYLDGVLIWARTFTYNRSARAQVAANLAVGSTASGFNSNGFFPLDFSQFPMKMRLKRMRILSFGE